MALFPASVEYALVGVPRSKGSKIFVVDYVNGSDSNPGTKWEAPLKTVEAAYALCTTLKNDVILLVGNGTSNQAAAAITWSKSYVHLIGLNSGGPEPRSRVSSPAALATTPFIAWSGTGCVVRNISFWHASSNVASLVNVAVSGERNTFEGCQFAGGAGANAVTGARSLTVTGSGNTFKGCIVGLDTIMSVNGMGGVEFVTGAMHTTFEDCQFLTSTNGTTYANVIVAAAAGVGRFNLFKKCLFVNEGNGVQAEVFALGAALPVSSYIYAIDCWKYGVTKWDANNRGVINNGEYATSVTGTNASNTLLITSA
jgi:hypothetical protein